MPLDLQIYLLGKFRLLIKGAAVSSTAWQKRKARLLVQFLALQPMREAHREELIERLFPDISCETSNANFYRVLYAARRALEPNRASYEASHWLVSDGRKIRLIADEIWVDADEFELNADKGLKTNNNDLLESATTLYKGDLLIDEPFEDWVTNRRELLKMLHHRVLHRLAENSKEAKDFDKSHFWLDKALSLEPADETAHRAKMRLFCQKGERFHALRQYEKCAAILNREFAIEPDEETKRLKQKIIETGRG